MTSGKKIFSSLLAGALAFAGVQATQAETVAWWRFDNGIGGAAVESTHEATVYQGGIPDYSGNGNVLLSFWDEDAPGNGTIYYDTEVPPVVSGGNVLSIRSQGSWPSMFTWSNESKPTLDLETIELREWTVEAFIKPGAVDGHRTIVGRDGAHNGGAAAVFYFKINDGVARIEVGDSAGNWYNQGGTRQIEPNRWYYYAAVCDGANLTIYLADLTAGETVAQADATVALTGYTAMVAWPDPDTAQTNVDPSPRQAWSVARGYYDSNDNDRYQGLIDEVRISNHALNIATEGLLATGLPAVEADDVEFTVPADGTQFDLGTTVTMTAEVLGGAITGPVVFSVNGTTVGLVQSAPYTFEWMPPATGNYRLSVVAYDGNNELVDRTPPAITVVPGVDFDVTGGGDGVDGTVTASSDLPNWDELAIYAFDNNTSTFWTSAVLSGGPQWIQFQLNTPKPINAYSILGRGGFLDRLPNEFTLQGSNNGVDWVDLDSRTGHETIARTVFLLPQRSAAYSYYRLLITRVQGGTDPETNAVEIEFLNLPVVVSLSADRTRVNLSTPQSASVTLTATVEYAESDIVAIQFFDGVRSLGYGVPAGDGTYSLEVHPTTPGTMDVTALVWTEDDLVVLPINSLSIEVAAFVNAVNPQVWSLY